MSRPPLLCQEGSGAHPRKTRGHRPRLQKERRLDMRNDIEFVAGNGLLHRRAFLNGGAAFAGAMMGYSFVQPASAQQLTDPPWSLEPGATVPDYGVRSRFEKNVVRTLSNPNGEPRNQHARTPHHLLNGTLTPNSLHFVISHAGDPDIDPDKIGRASRRERVSSSQGAEQV